MTQKTESSKKSLVAVVHCFSYDDAEVFQAVEKGLRLLGGISAFFTKGEHILLKPNVLVGVAPHHCATTHPAVFDAVIRHLQTYGLKLSYGDSPGFGAPVKAMKIAGLDDIAQKHGVAFADFEHGEQVTHPDGLMRKTFPIARGVLDTDGLVSLSKFKSHGLVRYTGAVKNQYGCIPGIKKTQFHAQIPFVHDFCQFIVDINTFIKPRLYIIDGIMAMEGNGPNSGDPKKIGCLIFSTDPVAADATACRIIRLNPEFVPTNKAGFRSGLGTYHEDAIELVGDGIASIEDSSFRVVRMRAMSISGRGIVSKIMSQLLPKPVINHERCIKCGRCVEICPVNPRAVNWRHDQRKDNPPVYTYSRCIRCFCCQETCPSKAIEIRTSALGIVLPVFSTGLVFLSGLQFVIKHYFKKLYRRLFNGKKAQSS